MAGLVPAIHVFILVHQSKDVDARPKAGHDGDGRPMADMANKVSRNSFVYD